MRKDQKHRISALFLLLLSTLVFTVPSANASDGKTILSGIILDAETRQPISNASVTVWDSRVLAAQGYTDQTGLFSLQVPINRNYRIYFLAPPTSGGWSHTPSVREVYATGAVDLTVELRPGATMFVDNDIQFVDATTVPNIFSFEVIDAKTERTLEIDGFKFVYGSTEDSQMRPLQLNATHLIVPMGVPFNIRVNASTLASGRTGFRSFVIDDLSNLNISKGDLVHIDVRKYSLKYNFAMVTDEIDAVSNEIESMDKLGFYLIVEKQGLVSVSKTVDLARFDMLREAYVDSFKGLRRAYVDITDLHNSLIDMYRSAATSVYILVFFLAFTATAICFLIFNRALAKVLSSAALTTLMHILLHEIYPGASYVPTTLFLESSVIAWLSSLIVTIFLPHFMKGRAVDGKTPLRNIIVPIFSLAKRSLMRRRLRFVLTLSSVTILVMSFVSLTSFNLGYGLILSRLSNQYAPVNGVLIRAPSKGPMLSEASFTPLEPTAIDWLQKQSEIELVAPIAQTQPLLLPSNWLQGRPVFGVLGVRPSVEAQLVKFDEIVVEGRYLRDNEEAAVLLSEGLKKELSIEVDTALMLGRSRVKVVGFYDYRKLTQLSDLDGTSLVPRKLVNLSPPGEPPSIAVFPVEEDELIICTFETAMKIPGVALSYVDAVLKEGESANDFAERAALERDYIAWASSTAGLYIARLGTYFQGKGIPLVIPWVIVVFNVVITMLNALYERRREIEILSSVGLNPGHIGGIFVAEAVAIGLIGGGAGYLLGLETYRAMTALQITLEVKQKVSAVWSFGALGIAMAAVVIGAVSALRGSVVITPSLMRRWQIQDREELGQPLEVILPISVPENEIDDFMDYMLKNLMAYEGDPVTRTERIRTWTQRDEKKSVRGIRFIYRTVGPAFSSYSLNELMAEKLEDHVTYSVRMLSNGDKKWVHQTGTLVRMIIMRWSTRR